MATEKRLIEYYVVRNKSTGFYFRGKGANRWGKYYNQASIYRVRAHAENTENWLNLRGEPVEIVPIEIKENTTVDAVEVVPGRWELHGNDDDCGCSYFCSNCHESCDEDWFYVHGKYRHLNYCPNCGAKMDKEDNNGNET
jgi:hypothetical protein